MFHFNRSEWGVTFNQCCCEGKGGYWGTEKQCFACDNSIAKVTKEFSFSIPRYFFKDLSCATVREIDAENSTGSSSSSSDSSSDDSDDNSFNPDQFRPDYDDSSENAFPSYDPMDNMEEDFDDSSLPGYSSMDEDLSSIMGPNMSDDNRAVPISNPEVEQEGIKRKGQRTFPVREKCEIN